MAKITLKLLWLIDLSNFFVKTESNKPVKILITIVIGIVISSFTIEIELPLTEDIYTPKKVVNKVIATVSSAEAPTKSIWGIALSCPIFLLIKSTIDGTKTAGLTAAIIKPKIDPWTNVNFRNIMDKTAIVRPSKVAGIILNKIAGLPICFIWVKLIPRPPINNTVIKARSLI